MEFSRQEYWIGLPFPSPRYLPDPGTMVQPGINLSGNLEEFTYFRFLSEKTVMTETEQEQGGHREPEQMQHLLALLPLTHNTLPRVGGCQTHHPLRVGSSET